VKILSWNTNGLRSALKKGFLDWFKDQKADIVCAQETKASPEQLPEDVKDIKGYTPYFSSARKKGYSGVACWSKVRPESFSDGLGEEKFDNEGRLIELDFGKFTLFNVYFPNGKMSPQRLKFKMGFYERFLKLTEKLLKNKKRIIVCGDVNTAHKEIDLTRPKENEMISGFLPKERAWIDKFLSKGFTDSFRLFNKEGGEYTWWDFKTSSRKRNVGWRIDYFFISDNLKPKIKSSFIQKEVYGSDHCPVGIEIDL
jgi:exodeoxyribonuclease-3